MKRKFILSIFATILTTSIMLVPVFAQRGSGTSSSGTSTTTDNKTPVNLNPAPKGDNLNPPPKCTTATCAANPSAQAGGFNLNVKINNPLHVETIQDAIKLFMNAIVKIAIPFIVVFFIWSGFNFIMAQGNPEKLKKAKMMFFNTVIGTLLILGAWAITNAIIGTVNSISS